MRTKRTYEEIEAIALQYTTLKDFIKNEKSAYTISNVTKKQRNTQLMLSLENKAQDILLVHLLEDG